MLRWIDGSCWLLLSMEISQLFKVHKWTKNKTVLVIFWYVNAYDLTNCGFKTHLIWVMLAWRLIVWRSQDVEACAYSFIDIFPWQHVKND